MMEYHDLGNTAKTCAEVCLLEMERAGSFPKLLDDDGKYTKEARKKLDELGGIFTEILEESTK